MEFKVILFIAILCVYLVASIIGFALMAIDKKKAEKHQYRIRERTLFLSAGLFGGIGSFLGMQICRHKTKHMSFVIIVPLCAIIQLGLLVWAFVALL